MKLTILGNNSALPAYGRYPTCQIVEIDGTLIMIDCGEAAQILMKKHGISWRKLKHIFISHLHGDHYFGLPGLLNSMSLLGRTESLKLYAPAALEPIISQILSVADTILHYDLQFIPLQPDAEMLEDNNLFSLFSFPVEHRIFCKGLVITEKSKGRKLLPERCSYYEIPTAYYRQIKAGQDYHCKDGTIIKNEWISTEGKPSKRYAYCADTLFTHSFLQHIQDADLLYHESTYLEEDAHKAESRYHSTAAQAAQIAVFSRAQLLVLGHYSSKYKSTEDFATEACTIFPNSHASQEGDVFEI